MLPTIAEGTAIAHPLRLREMVAALRVTGGSTVAVPEDGIVRALDRLCGEGLFVEPTSATAAAALTLLLERGTIAPRDTTVVMLSGTGLKAAPAVRDLVSAARTGRGGASDDEGPNTGW